MTQTRFLFLLLLLQLFLCCTIQCSFSSNSYCGGALETVFEDDVSPKTKERISHWLQKFFSPSPSSSTPKIIVSIGANTPYSQQLISSSELQTLGSEGFILRSSKRQTDEPFIIAVAGNPRTRQLPSHNSGDNLGLAYGAYTLLQQVFGVFFGHPFNTLLPSADELSCNTNVTDILFKQQRLPVDMVEKPMWTERAVHYHSEHPLELTEFLNGLGKNMSTTEEDWRAGMADYESFLEWLVANRQNGLEYNLLDAAHWAAYSESEQRRQRLQQIVNLAHDYALDIGIDCPIGMRQQHSYSLIRKGDKDPLAALTKRLDFVMSAGYDAFSTELGLSEFTHGSVLDMLKYLNATSKLVHDKYNKKMFCKSHISQGQIIKEMIDPITGKPGLNFNFLVYYSDPRIITMPHTVQVYSFFDPAYTYGNKNFSQMYHYLEKEVENGRDVVFFPETAYWINYDVNVPLFLAPIYVNRRLMDVRNLYKFSTYKNFKGQMIFSSGSEFGYWINDICTMRMTWSSYEQYSTHQEAMTALLHDVFRPLIPTDTERNQFTTLFVQTMVEQENFFIYGKLLNGTQPPTVEKYTGLDYLIGSDTWSEISELVDKLTGKIISTQPYKYEFTALQKGHNVNEYVSFLRYLFNDMVQSFSKTTDAISQLPLHQFSISATSVVKEVANLYRLLTYRARQVALTYEYAFNQSHKKPVDKTQLRQVLLDAQSLMDSIELSRPVSGKWNPSNPTVYRFNFLWQAKTLYFWWRDYGKLVYNHHSPCFMNLQSPVDVALGEGFTEYLAEWFRKIFEHIKIIHNLTDCLAAPDREPKVPPFQP